MRRRVFVALFGAAAWRRPLLAQTAERKRRIGVLIPHAEDDAEVQTHVATFRERLRQLGWTDGGNAQIDSRWGGGDAARLAGLAKEIVALRPDVILGRSTPVISALLQETRTIPIVFANVIDPVGAGFVASLARPGGNVTGFTNSREPLAQKGLELLKEMAPKVTRVAVLFNPKNPQSRSFLQSLEKVAPALKVAMVPAPVANAADIENAVGRLARQPNGALYSPFDAMLLSHRKLILSLAARHRLPALYLFRFFAAEGGLAAYGPDLREVYRQAAGYVDRILKGERPAALPVQAPDKFELIINLKTAKALGLEVPASLLARADEVIE